MVESTYDRIHSKLNQLQVASTYGCKVKEGQSQRSKKVKPSSAVGFARVRRPPRPVHAQSPRIGAGKLGRELGQASCKLEAGWQAVSWKHKVRAGSRELRAGLSKLSKLRAEAK